MSSLAFVLTSAYNDLSEFCCDTFFKALQHTKRDPKAKEENFGRDFQIGYFLQLSKTSLFTRISEYYNQFFLNFKFRQSLEASA